MIFSGNLMRRNVVARDKCPYLHVCCRERSVYQLSAKIEVLPVFVTLIRQVWVYILNSSSEDLIPSVINRGVSISPFVLKEPDSIWFHHDIIFSLESDSIVVSFSLGAGFLRQLTNEKWRVREFGSLRKSTKRRNPDPHLRTGFLLFGGGIQ